MPVHVVCPQCGQENKTVGVFCAKCGARMGAPSVQQRREAFPIGRVLGNLVRLASILVLALIVGAAFWPLEVAETAVDETRAKKLGEWVVAMEKLIQQRGTTASMIGDDDINNYLAWRVRETPEASKPKGMQLGLDRIRVEIRGDRIRAVALGGWGAIRLSFDIRGLPETSDRAFRLNVREARLGHLKLPGFAHGWVAEKLEQILGGLSRERAVLDHVKRADLADGKVRLVIAP